MRMATYCGQPCYAPASDRVKVFVSVQGGHLTAEWSERGRTLSPFWVPPWWKEPWIEDTDWIMRLLRGDFFCLPFGSNIEPVDGRQYPLHGQTANDCWEPVREERAGAERSLVLRMALANPGAEVEKTVRLVDGQPVIYQRHVVRGLELRSPVGHHPTLHCPDEPGSAILDLSKPLAGFTVPIPSGTPETQGYHLLATGVEITDRTRVPTVYGGVADASRYPMRKGHEDGVLFISDPGLPFAFTAVSMPGDELLYFQLKDPRVLCGTIFWMCDGGRYAPPLSGRATSVLGAEEITGYYWMGIQPSIAANHLRDRGYRTFVEFRADRPTDIRLVQGVVAIPRGFAGVKDIVQKDAGTVTIQGRGGEQIDVPCQVGWLKG